MVIFKGLSLKALIVLQDHEGGGRGKKITQMFISDSAYLYINTSTHSHICCTHSLSPSLPLPLIHTHPPHTLKHSKSGGYGANQILGG